MNEHRTSRRPWEFREPFSNEDRNDHPGEFQERGPRSRGEGGWGQGGHARYDDAFGKGRDPQRRYGAGSFGEGRYGNTYEEPYGDDPFGADNPYGTMPSTGNVMRSERGAPRGGWNRPDALQALRQRREGEGEGYEGGRPEGGRVRGRGDERERYGGGPFPDQNRTPWHDRYEPDDPETRERLAGAYGISDVGQLDAQAWQDDDNARHRVAGARWRDEGGRFPQSERPGMGGRTAGWPGQDWDDRNRGQGHGRDDAYERFSGGPQRNRWGQGGVGGGVRRVAPKGYRRSDERIQEDLCERLAHDHRVDVEHVEVTVREGVVTLSGTVRDRQQKFHIEDIADDTFGVTEVENRIRVQRDDAGGGGGAGSGGAGLGKVPQAGVSEQTRPVEGHVSGVSVSGSNTGTTASSYAGGMEVGAGELPADRDPYGGTTRPDQRTT